MHHITLLRFLVNWSKNLKSPLFSGTVFVTCCFRGNFVWERWSGETASLCETWNMRQCHQSFIYASLSPAGELLLGPGSRMTCPGPGGPLTPDVVKPLGANLTPPVCTVEYPGPGLDPEAKLALLVICVNPGLLEVDVVLTKLLLFGRLWMLGE